MLYTMPMGSIECYAIILTHSSDITTLKQLAISATFQSESNYNGCIHVLTNCNWLSINLHVLHITMYAEIFARRKFSPILPMHAVGENFFPQVFWHSENFDTSH